MLCILYACIYCMYVYICMYVEKNFFAASLRGATKNVLMAGPLSKGGRGPLRKKILFLEHLFLFFCHKILLYTTYGHMDKDKFRGPLSGP